MTRSRSESNGRWRGRGRGSLLALVALLAAALVAGLAGSPAEASTVALSNVVSAVPASYTPQANDGATYAFLQVGSTMYAGGSFTSVTAAAKSSPSGTFTRDHLVAFEATTGSISSFAPVFNGDVWSLASDGTYLYVGGTFTTVNGVARTGLAAFDLATGALVTSFDAKLDGGVTAAQVTGGRLIVGGSFGTRIRALNLRTGADTGYLKLAVTGKVGGRVEILRFAVNPAGTELVAIGAFTTVNGAAHARAFMVDLGIAAATLSTWNYAPFASYCWHTKQAAYLRGVDFSPDGSYFVVVATGYLPRTSDGTEVCDAAARFETSVLNPSKPTWVNYTGGDSLYSVAITASAVYVQGHQRWMDNPKGVDSAGAGAVSRPGIAALDPATGNALSWNPTKDRGAGGKVLYVTEAGLWVGSDTLRIANRKHARIALMPAS